MPHLVWSDEALQDLHRIFHQVAAIDSRFAGRVVGRIRKDAKQLLRLPQIGRRILHDASERREWLVTFGRSGYVIQYEIDGKNVLVLRVRHQRQGGY